MDRMRRCSDPVCIDPTRERSRWPRRSPLEAWPASTLPARPRQGQITHPFAIPPPCSRSQRAVRGAPLQGSGVSACSDGLGERAAERIAPRQLAPSRPESSPDGRIGPDDTSAPVTLLRPSRPSEPLHRLFLRVPGKSTRRATKETAQFGGIISRNHAWYRACDRLLAGSANPSPP